MLTRSARASHDKKRAIGKLSCIPLFGPTTVLLLLAMVACEYPGIPHPLAEELQVSQSGATGRTVATAGGRQGSGTSTSSADAVASGVLQGRVEITLRDFSLNPNAVTVRAGRTTFVLKNEGRYTHDFRVQGEGADETAPKVGAGRMGEWTLTLAPGVYRISCPISNHDERGMEGTMTVVP